MVEYLLNMPWYFPWSESIKKRACRYLLQHYLGDFLKEKLDLDQLTVDLYNGKGTVTNVLLDVWALNEMFSNAGVPVELIDGYISSISVSVPWKALLNDSCEIEIHGLSLTFSPKHKREGDLIDSTYSWNSLSMTTSIQLAQECLRQEPSPGEEQAESAQSFEGLEAFAQTIESVLARVRLSFQDTFIRFENVPMESTTGVGIDLKIDRIDYWDLSHEEVGRENTPQHSVYEPVAVAIKNFKMVGFSVFIEEFPQEKRTRIREASDDEFSQYFESQSKTFDSEDMDHHVGNQTKDIPDDILPKVKIVSSHGQQNMRIKLKQNDALPGPKVDVDYSLGAVNIFLTPRQLHLLIDALSAIPDEVGNSSQSDDTNSQQYNRAKTKMRMMKSEDYMKVEESLQQQFQSSRSNQHQQQQSDLMKQNWGQTFESLKSQGNISLGSTTASEDEFFSMSEYPLPALGQPSLLNTVRQHVSEAQSFTPASPRSTLSNISLGGSSGSLSTKGTLTEKASTVFRASSAGSLASKFSPGYTSPSNTTHNIGLAGVSTLDDSLDITHIKLRASNIILFLLHRDPLISKSKQGSSIKQEYSLEEMAEDYFHQIGQYSKQPLFGINMEDIQKSMLTVCCYDHLRILASAVTVETEQRNMTSGKTLNTDVIIGKLALDENLYDDVTKQKTNFKIPYSKTKILEFEFPDDSPLYAGAFGASQSPCVKIKIHKTSRTSSMSVQSRATVPPKSSVVIEFGLLNIDVDVTLMDRIGSLLWPGPLYKTTGESQPSSFMYASLATGRSTNHQTAFRQVIEDSPIMLDYKTDLTVRCPNATLYLRFPKPDLRPSTVDKRPWWIKDNHKESLKILLEGAEFKTTLHSFHGSSSYEILFKKAKGYFLTSLQCYHMFDIESTCEEGETGSMGIDMPRILINSSPPSRSVFEEMDHTSKDSSPDSLEDQYPWMKSDPSPFASKPNMYGDNEEIVTPGSIAEMNAFQESATMMSKFAVNCYFPSMQMNLLTNSIFEVLYNRLFSDLVMWEPIAPSSVEGATKTISPYDNVHINLASHFGQLDSTSGPTSGAAVNDKFFMCRSAIRDAYDSHSADTSLFSGDYNDSPVPNKHQQTKMTFSLHIDKGKIALFPPCKNTEPHEDMTSSTPTSSNEDTELADELDENYAHVVLNIKDGHLFIASGYKGQLNTDLIELYTNNIELYHSSTVNPAVDFYKMEDAVSIDFLVPTIYPSESTVKSKFSANKLNNEQTAMLSLAMRCIADQEGKKKDNLVSVSLNGGTLNYKSLPPGQMVFMQLIDFMDIQDYPIDGYSFPKSITTLHTHLMQCAVDYRPVHIPIHCLLTMEAFSLSSNLIPGSSTSILRFVIEDSTFFICDKSKLPSDMNNFNNYISVMDMGLFELSLKLTDGVDKRQPLMDLSMSNSMLYIRTCSDSCIGLMELIKYIAADGDLHNDNQQNNETNQHQVDLDCTLPCQTTVDGQLIDSTHIDSLMADAMLDDTEEENQENFDTVDRGGECHHRFEGTLIDECLDESNDDIQNEEEEPTSGDFCFLDNEMPKQLSTDDPPIIRLLVKERIKVIDDFFQPPLGKFDQLGSPDGYPPPLYRYTVREMSLVWQMYGGSDFDTKNHCSPSSSPSSPSFASPSSKSERQTPRLAKHENRNEIKNKGNVSIGGPNRDMNTLMELQLNKLRFMHEIYPYDMKQIYRDVLLIYDLEIRDRLSTSQINKFLYQYSSESLPKQSSANMVTIKFLVTKPDDDARSEEASLRISLQPLRLNVDQDSLFFLKDFFSEISGSKPIHVNTTPAFNSALSSSPGREPFQTVCDVPSPSQSSGTPNVSTESCKVERPTSNMFIKTFIFSPDVPIRLDYQGKHVNIEQGTLAGLIIGLSQLNCSELRLKRLCNRTGLLGADKLMNYILTEWLNDIKVNQLQSILGGVGPAYSFLKLFQGIKDLFWMPVQQYRQDGRIVRGLQRGAHSFSTSTAMAVLELSNRLVSTIQSLAELTFDMVSPGPRHVSTLQTTRNSSSQAVHPAELREGVANAYAVLSEGLTETATNIVLVATEEHEKKGMTGAVGGVLRQIPPTVVKPLILATEAASNVLGGAMNQLAPDKRREALEKWKSDNDS